MSAAKQIGERVGPYQLIGVLGVGGAGQVFRALWNPTDEERAEAPPDHPPEVALKLLLPSAAANEAIFRRFVREIVVAQQIDHPHILRFIDSGLAGELLYYAMEIAPHGSLREVIQRKRTLPWRDAVEAAAHVADGLSALHDRGVVHRDLKPENVFLAGDGALKLGDFGLVRRDDGAELTTAGQTVGSVRYMAPEQVRGKRDIDGRSDLYALGCVLFELLTGRPPFQSTQAMVVFQQHCEEPPPKLRSLAPAAPATLERLVDCLLAKEKEDRPASAHCVLDTLQAMLASEAGEVEGLEDLLDGTAADIEPLPIEEDEDDSLAGSHGLSSRGLLSSAVDDDDDDDDDDLDALPKPAKVEGLSQRLAGAAAKEKKGCAGVLLVGLGLLAFAAAAMAGVARGDAVAPVPDTPFLQQETVHREIQAGLPSPDVHGVEATPEGVRVTTATGDAAWDGASWRPVAAVAGADDARPADAPPHVAIRHRQVATDAGNRNRPSSSAVAAAEGLYERRGKGDCQRLTPRDTNGLVWADSDVRGAAFDESGRLWFATPAGVGVRDGETWTFYDRQSGLPYNDFTCVARATGGGVWFGTRRGAIHFDGVSWAYRQGPRWLPHDEVRAIAIDEDGDAWFATPAGVGCIATRERTLAAKASIYEAEIEERIKRTPYGFVAESLMDSPGDKASAKPLDSDNDGLWTAMYGAAQCFAYAKDRTPEAKRRADQAFAALRFLQTVTQGGEHSPDDGFVARTVLPTDGPDPNVGRLEADRRERETGDRMWKVYEPRWPRSADGKWWWKSDTSSDELDGHYFFHALYFDHVAQTDAEREAVRDVVRRLTDHLVSHNYTLTDHDGMPTRWADFGPDALNHDPRWAAERGLNSLSMLAYLAIAGHVTGDSKYEKVAKRLRDEHAYDTNAMNPKWQRGVGSGNHSDDEMAVMNFYHLVKYTADPALRERYLASFYSYWRLEEPERNPFFNFAYAAVADEGETKLETTFGPADLAPQGEWLAHSVETLRLMPLDRVEWPHTNAHRLDIRPLNPAATTDVFEPFGAQDATRGQRLDGSPIPVDERSFNHWNHDPWRLNSGGDGRQLGSGTVFLLPYHMGRYHGFIE